MSNIERDSRVEFLKHLRFVHFALTTVSVTLALVHIPIPTPARTEGEIRDIKNLQDAISRHTLGKFDSDALSRERHPLGYEMPRKSVVTWEFEIGDEKVQVSIPRSDFHRVMPLDPWVDWFDGSVGSLAPWYGVPPGYTPAPEVAPAIETLEQIEGFWSYYFNVVVVAASRELFTNGKGAPREECFRIYDSNYEEFADWIKSGEEEPWEIKSWGYQRRLLEITFGDTKFRACGPIAVEEPVLPRRVRGRFIVVLSKERGAFRAARRAESSSMPGSEGPVPSGFYCPDVYVGIELGNVFEGSSRNRDTD